MNRTGAMRRSYEGPALFSAGFRPFFLGGALYAGLAVPAWLLLLRGSLAAGPLLDPLSWHAHEMVFGYLAAIIGGFLLTAIPNWTGRLPVMGAPLAFLAALWLAGRLGTATLLAGLLSPVQAAVLDLAYPFALTAVAFREVASGRNWRNLPVVCLVGTFAAADLLFHLANVRDLFDPMLAIRAALGVTAMLISLIGGRITPSFTRNWLAKNGADRFPAPFDRVDKAALVLTGVALVGWLLTPTGTVAGALLLLAAMLQAVRLGRWCGHRTVREPLVLILHVGYGWLVVALFAMAAAAFAPAAFDPRAALHALTAGAIGTMTMAVMTRATLGHTGRALVADRGTQVIYLLVNAGALLRVAAPCLPVDYIAVVSLSGILWSASFLFFAIRYGAYLVAPRR